MAKFTGGPNTEFINGRLATIFGSSGWLISKMVTLSLPGGENMGLPLSSQKTLASIPTITRWAKAEADHAPRQTASATPSMRVKARFFMSFSGFGISIGCVRLLPLDERLGLGIARVELASDRGDFAVAQLDHDQDHETIYSGGS